MTHATTIPGGAILASVTPHLERTDRFARPILRALNLSRLQPHTSRCRP